MGQESQLPVIVAVSGFASEVGKTTLMCDLLKVFPGWEAIKMTRGHYRSCGKDPDVCCVSNLLSDQPVIRSGREQTYVPGKDTGRYWDAGAANVHWVIVTDNQVEEGIREALKRVSAPGVLVEGNSFLDYVSADFVVMVARAEGGIIKTSARRALANASALFLTTSDENQNGHDELKQFASWRSLHPVKEIIPDLPIFTRAGMPQLITRIRETLTLRPPPAPLPTLKSPPP